MRTKKILLELEYSGNPKSLILLKNESSINFFRPDQALASFGRAQQKTARDSVAINPEQATASPKIHHLTSRELEILQLAINGKQTKVIAQTLGLSPYTVTDHLKSIYLKLNVHSRVEAANKVFSLKLASSIHD